MVVIQLPRGLVTASYVTLKQRLQTRGWLLHEKFVRSSSDFSDKLSTDFDLLIALSSNYFPRLDPTAIHHLSPTPAVPNGMSPKLLVEFNQPQYALPYIGDLFTVEIGTIKPMRQPTVQ